MKRFPAEFADLLSARGRRVLAGRDRISGVLAQGLRLVSAPDLLAPGKSAGALGLLERAMHDVLTPMDAPIPDDATGKMTASYSELLPKVARVRTALMASARSRGSQRAEEIGLTAMLRSDSFHALAEAVSGYRLREKRGTQLLCYDANGYAGPHNDHHPEERSARGGYVDLHVSFCTAAVEHQWLVYEHQGHLGQIQSITAPGALTCYRLPVWHYTTPLSAWTGRRADARRWVLLGTFLDRAPAARG